MNRLLSIAILLTIVNGTLQAQVADRWQQRVQYKMEIDVDVENHQLIGKQWLDYINNSPDSLSSVFYHLYFNAFQPFSMMDIRSRTIPDPDPRVADRIFSLSEEEQGYQKILKLEMNGVACDFHVEGTILEVELPQAIKPGETVSFYMEFETQVPVMIRRSGRNSKEGISYSMGQWYPKLCEYDYQGWHANPYIGREFHGVWGDFDVTIDIDADYMVAATGVLSNPQQVGFLKNALTRKNSNKRSWNFKAENVHDFVWAADPDYKHIMKKTKTGVEMHYYYQDGPLATENFPMLPDIMDAAFDYLTENYGEYPYPVYRFIQGGDRGMEYPMATLINGERTITELTGTAIHELVHAWFHTVLASNESLYAWMDEGFANYVGAHLSNYLIKNKLMPGTYNPDRFKEKMRAYANYTSFGIEEPMSTHADHFVTNKAYGEGSYTKGTVFLNQLNYIIGEEALKQGMKNYYNTWKFKHPNPNDFVRVMEKTSGLELDWYKEYMLNSTHTIDYSIDTIGRSSNGTEILLIKYGRMPMPVDLEVELNDGEKVTYNIPLRMMRGHKKSPPGKKQIVLDDWPWTHPGYLFHIDIEPERIKQIRIDPNNYTADTNVDNNVWPRSDDLEN